MRKTSSRLSDDMAAAAGPDARCSIRASRSWAGARGSGGRGAGGRAARAAANPRVPASPPSLASEAETREKRRCGRGWGREKL